MTIRLSVMDETLQEMAYSSPVLITVGAVLLLFGRKLYWLAIGTLGFLLALRIVQQNFSLEVDHQVLVATLSGVASIFFAVLAKKIAITVGGFGIGAILAYYLAEPYAESLSYQIWFVVLLGALFGVCFAAFLFKAALVVVTALVGAMLVTQGLTLEREHEIWTFLGLTLVGVVLQTRGKKAPRAD